jgi:hypothetical protein
MAAQGSRRTETPRPAGARYRFGRCKHKRTTANNVPTRCRGCGISCHGPSTRLPKAPRKLPSAGDRSERGGAGESRPESLKSAASRYQISSSTNDATVMSSWFASAHYAGLPSFPGALDFSQPRPEGNVIVPAKKLARAAHRGPNPIGPASSNGAGVERTHRG